MSWETRQRGGAYYTRSRWVDGRVVREYVGGGVIGRLAAQQDELERLQREQEAARRKEERERLERSVGFLRELDEAAEVLMRAELLASGCHKHKGEWRRLRARA
jgi:ribosomal protein S2